MAVLHFDKNELGNLEYSLQREMLSTNRAGGYMSTTIVCCNTRKYHVLMVCPKDDRDENNYVLLSSVDETVVQHEQSFNLAIHRFPGVYDPRGHKYITDFTYTPAPAITYRVGGVILKKELLWIHSRTQLLIRYTLLDARSQTQLRLRPFLAFRDRHTVGRANMEADGRSYPIEGGVRNRLYEGFPWLHMQIDAPSEFVAAPDWYYNFEYGEEIARGYPGHEDLLTTGYFELDIAKGQSVIFSCSTEPVDPSTLDQVFEEELSRRSNKIDFLSCLRHSARQGGPRKLWKKYGSPMKAILEAYRDGANPYVRVDDNALVWAAHPRYAMTWMDAVVDGKPVTGREGYQVEVNALWYNAVRYALELARKSKDTAFVERWEPMPERIRKSFLELFWYEREEFLADYVDEHGQNTFIRPNQIIACSLPYGMLGEGMKRSVIDTVRRHLLTPKGLRTLSPRNPLYEGRCVGDQPTRDRAYHQGTVWPWLLEHYVKACFDMHGKAFLPEARDMLKNFEEDISVSGIASINEIYDGDPPHNPRGAVSQAWSVGAILRIAQMIEAYEIKK